MFRKERLLLKIIFVIALIILIFAVIILISYETQYRNQPLINNGNTSEYEIPLSNTEIDETTDVYLLPPINQPNNIPDEEPTLDELQITISPDDNVISGFIQITIDEYPDGTEEILIMISPKDSDDPVEDEDTFINFIEVPFNDEFVIDTKDFPNGEYLLTVASTHDSTPENDPWTSIIRQEFVISN